MDRLIKITTALPVVAVAAVAAIISDQHGPPAVRDPARPATRLPDGLDDLLVVHPALPGPRRS